MNLREEMDRSAVSAFENDLRDMTIEQMQSELDQVTDRIDEDTAWQEALTAAIRLFGKEKAA